MQVYFCPACKSVWSSDTDSDAPLVCLECKTNLVSTGIERDTWREMSKPEKEAAKIRFQASIDRERKINEEFHYKQISQTRVEAINALKDKGTEGYWEYKVIPSIDPATGRIDYNKMETMLNELGLQGWKLITAFANELGKNSSAVGLGGFSTGTNTTVEAAVLVLERYVMI